MTKSSIISRLKSLGRPTPSGREPEEFVRLFKKHKPAIYRNLDSFGMNFAQLCFPLLYVRCATGYHAEERPEFLLVTNHRRHYVLPLTGDRQEFMSAVFDLLGQGGKVVAFPETASLFNRADRYPQYVCETQFLATLPGRKVKAYRHDVRRLEAMGVVVEEGTGSASDLFALNERWYSEFADRKGFQADRFSESEALISLACLRQDDKDLVRTFRAMIPAGEGAAGAMKLCGFLITCRMSESYWACVLSRSLVEHSGLGHYLWQRAAQAYLKEGVPMENDDTGGPDPALCAYKERFASGLITTYQVRSRRLPKFLLRASKVTVQGRAIDVRGGDS